MNQLTITQDHEQNRAALIPAAAGKDTGHRLGKYVQWLEERGAAWHDPELSDYRDQLLQTLKPASAAAHLATIRGRYRELLTDNRIRDRLEITVRESLEAAGKPAGPADVEALVNRKLTRLENGISPRLSRVKVTKVQDAADSQYTWLTREQAERLQQAPSTDTLSGLRDAALIGLMLATGIRAAEAAALEVSDLRQTLGGELALQVREGKGMKQRLIPYGDMSAALVYVDAWLQQAGISKGPVFRGVYKSGHRIRSQALTTRTVENILANYPITVNGELITVTPHDLRRTYARLMYLASVDLISIQQNLGHASLQTTQRYIGTLDAAARRAPELFRWNLDALKDVILV
jgi:integrase